MQLRLCSVTKLEGLENLKKLEVLYLGSSDIVKIEGLKGLTNLKWLSLGNDLTSIKGLESFSQLEFLGLSTNKNLNQDEIDKLKNKLPNCNIHFTTK